MRVFFIGIFLLNTAFTFAQTKLKFEKVATMPREAIRGGYSQSEDEIYVVGGSGAHHRVLSHLQIYNANNEKWLDLPIKPLSRVYDQSAVYLDDYKGIFLAGGVKPHKGDLLLVDDIRMVYKDDLKINSLGQLPFPARNLGIAAHDKRVFLFGGTVSHKPTKKGRQWKREFSNKLSVYNLENGHLHVFPDMPMAMETQGAILGRHLYMMGGYNGKSLNTVWRFDLLEETWESLSPLKRPLSGYALTQFEQYLIMVGGFGHENKIMVYDTETQQSYQFKTNLGGRFQGASILNNELHVYGGTKKGYDGYPGHHKLTLSTLLMSIKKRAIQ